MFIKIPFESIIDFKTNISEITKMSLEHEFNVNDGVVLGNFYVSGEYRVHEVSINTEPFNYTLPFTVELRDDIKEDTLEFNIEDFYYDILDKKLKINVEYSLQAERKEDLFERVDESKLDSELSFIDNFLDEEEQNKDEVKDEIVLELPKEKCEDNSFKEDSKPSKVEVANEKDSDRISKEEEKTIMDTIKSSDDTFVTYHIHILKESETIENVCAMYGVANGLVSEYNNLEGLTVGDKILIPKVDE